ncbi:MAG: ATP-binding cassette domain-containing protein, partial [[Ruminococcus] lactaris]|nr:ATP-binding cassette domain-containing protein [[Ruminococcus] lactaris]
MIKVEHTNKTFSGKYGEVHALQDVSIHVEKGDIYGIIGFSGAGKSTLLRLVNGLE